VRGPDRRVPNAGAERELIMMRWGMPLPPGAGGYPVTNIRNTVTLKETCGLVIEQVIRRRPRNPPMQRKGEAIAGPRRSSHHFCRRLA
jgi:hypothetical protein